MTIEIPPQEVTEVEIVKLNSRLEILGLEAKLQGLSPVDLGESLETGSIDKQLPPNITPAGFWGHHIGGGVSSVAGLPPDMSDLIGPVQKRLHVLTQRWMIHPVGGADQLNLASSRAFLDSGLAFDWTKEPVFLGKLQDILADLGDFYSLREGRIPLGYSPHA